MHVSDTFLLAHGTTVFLGPVEPDTYPIPACECEIVVDDEVKARFHALGSLFERRDAPRVIHTVHVFDWQTLGLGRSGFDIRCIEWSVKGADPTTRPTSQ
jgi:hypothetical protein